MRRWIVGVGLVFVLALGLRLLHVAALQRAWEGTQAFSTARLDAADHVREALDILDQDPLLRDRVHWKGPGYSYFLAGLMLALGRDVGPFRWITAIIGALNCAGLTLLARKFLSAKGALIAGALVAVNGTVILFDAELYYPTLLLALSLPAIGLLVWKGASPLPSAVAGLLLGLAALVHPVYLFSAAGVGLWLAVRERRRAWPFVAAALLTVAPVAIKNVVALGEPVLISWNGGINFYIGNHPAFDQRSGQGTQAWDRIYHTTEDAGIKGESARDRHYYKLARRQIFEHPAAAAAGFVEKLAIFLAPLEVANNIRLYELREYSPVLRLTLGRAGPVYWPFGLWAPLAWFGVVLAARRKQPGYGLLLIVASASLVACCGFFNTARYRVPMVFVGTIWVGATIEWLWMQVRARDWRRLAVASAVLAALGLTTALINRPQVVLPPPWEHSEALVLERQRRYDEAAAHLAEVCRRDPDNAQLLLSAAAFHGRRAEQERSRDYLFAALELSDPGPDNLSNGYEMLARSYLVQGRLDDAERALDAALEVGVDESEWRGNPFFQIGLGPVSACRLRLIEAGIMARRFLISPAREILQGVRDECGAYGRVGERLREVESRIDSRSGRPPRR